MWRAHSRAPLRKMRKSWMLESINEGRRIEPQRKGFNAKAQGRKDRKYYSEDIEIILLIFLV